MPDNQHIKRVQIKRVEKRLAENVGRCGLKEIKSEELKQAVLDDMNTIAEHMVKRKKK